MVHHCMVVFWDDGKDDKPVMGVRKSSGFVDRGFCYNIDIPKILKGGTIPRILPVHEEFVKTIPEIQDYVDYPADSTNEEYF